MIKDDGEEFTEESKERDIYDEEERSELEESDEISPEEEGFMKGYEEGKKMASCPKCGRALGAEFVEREIHDEIYRFCSAHCSESFKMR